MKRNEGKSWKEEECATNKDNLSRNAEFASGSWQAVVHSRMRVSDGTCTDTRDTRCRDRIVFVAAALPCHWYATMGCKY